MNTNSNINNTHIQGLDIIRFLAAFSVVFGHMWMSGDNWTISENCRMWLPQIASHVTPFFVISGFLIMWQGLKEIERNGSLAVLASYKRRSSRLLPLYYLGIGVGLLAVWLTNYGIKGNLPLLLLLMPNFSHACSHGVMPLYHYWTMGVEFQFYIFFPLFVNAIVKRYAGNMDMITKKLLLWTILFATAWAGMKWGCYFVLGKIPAYRFLSSTQFDCILLGSVLALGYYRGYGWLKKLGSGWWFVVLSWMLFLMSYYWIGNLPSMVRQETMAAVCVMMIMSGIYGHPIGEYAFFKFFGKISYSIYIFHPIVIFVLTYLMSRYAFMTIMVNTKGLYVVSVVLLTILLAWGSDWSISKVRNIMDKRYV